MQIASQLNYNITIRHATFVCAINSFGKLAKLAQSVEQRIGNIQRMEVCVPRLTI